MSAPKEQMSFLQAVTELSLRDEVAYKVLSQIEDVDDWLITRDLKVVRLQRDQQDQALHVFFRTDTNRPLVLTDGIRVRADEARSIRSVLERGAHAPAKDWTRYLRLAGQIHLQHDQLGGDSQ